MRVLQTLALGFQYFILVYFAVVNLLYAWFSIIGMRAIAIYSREISLLALKDVLEQEIYQPVSVLVPAYNEEKSIIASVRSFVSLHYPQFEVIVVSDGSTDGTVRAMIEEFALVEDARFTPGVLLFQPVRRIFRSLQFPNLTVIDKGWGGKADALNAALEHARFPLVCAVDSDSILDAQALLRASRLFLEDEAVLAVGGAVRPLNGAVLEDGVVVEPRMPRKWLERLQVLEYVRAFFVGRAGWSRMGSLLIVSGAFGLFRREALVEVGGYWPGTVCEDMEIVIRLEKHHRDAGKPCRVIFAPDPICWTEVPSDLKTLRRQRNRWQRGLWTNLLRHRDMVFRTRYGRVGTFALPYFWLIEGLSPVVEVLGYLFLPLSLFLDVLLPQFALMFLVLAMLYGVLLSQVAAGAEAFLLARLPRFSDRVILFLAAFVEFLGYRQVLVLTRLHGTIQAFRRRGGWGAMQRTGIPADRRMTPAEPLK